MGEIEKEQAKPGFWDDRIRAQELTRELSEISENIETVRGLGDGLNDQSELFVLLTEDTGQHDMSEIVNDLEKIEDALTTKERELKFNGPHDRDDAIITIAAGAGGTDAQDWAMMLERMYLRFAEGRGWKTHSLDRSGGEEAGIKHSTFEVVGKLAYGVLRGEQGIHRLVRQSPFNADKLRQTSFAKVEVLPRLKEAEAPEIDAKDLQVDTFRASGAGGQHVNKTSSAVRIRHLPTGVVVQCQNERSQAQNKTQAMAILQAKLQILAEEQHASDINKLKGETKQAAWGNQIRSYVMHPYTMVKDHRTQVQVSDVKKVLDGDLAAFVLSV